MHQSHIIIIILATFPKILYQFLCLNQVYVVGSMVQRPRVQRLQYPHQCLKTLLKILIVKRLEVEFIFMDQVRLSIFNFISQKYCLDQCLFLVTI